MLNLLVTVTFYIILGQYFNIKFLPMLLYIFQMRWKKFNIKIYPWITLHIIIFQPEKYYRGNKRQRIPKGQSKMNNTEKLALI